MLDTTRVRRTGVGQHKRKNDAIDAETIAMAVESGRVPLAHVLSPERRELRAQLGVRGALVETRAHYVTTIRGLARAGGVMLPTCRTENFTDNLETASLNYTTRELMAIDVFEARCRHQALAGACRSTGELWIGHTPATVQRPRAS
jgi:hypothetical protein